jgi:3-oxoacyl-[acyl-carrier protein] reductase
MDLFGRVALVTGGSGDLGTAACIALARAGCDVALTYVGNREGAAQTVEAVEGLGRRACALPLDQTESQAIDSTVGAAAEALGRLDVLVNNAAWNIAVPFSPQTCGTACSPPTCAGHFSSRALPSRT